MIGLYWRWRLRWRYYRGTVKIRQNVWIAAQAADRRELRWALQAERAYYRMTALTFAGEGDLGRRLRAAGIVS